MGSLETVGDSFRPLLKRDARPPLSSRRSPTLHHGPPAPYLNERTRPTAAPRTAPVPVAGAGAGTPPSPADRGCARYFRAE